jgi:FAD/FMN-containing dehydrogenase/Fe-S oxidoreductase
VSPAVDAFLEALRADGFAGETTTRHDDRVVMATDNSIYQWLPQAVVFPRDAADVQRVARLAGEPAHRAVTLTARGGGTGTNGQSLTDGVVVDVSRHMNRILEIDVANRRVRVECGVVKDQLNAVLAPHGLFFAPELSTSSRATIGGMIATDASGQGSCTYGKTRDHVCSLDVVLLGGERIESAPVDDAGLRALCAAPGRIGEVHRVAAAIAGERRDEIAAVFPKLDRCMTGYDLAHLRTADGLFDLNSLVCGAEGSLGFVVAATLGVLTIPRFSMLVNIRYRSFMAALRDAQRLMAHRPLSIETVDAKVLGLARRDIVWHRVARLFPDDGERRAEAVNLVEFAGDDEADVRARADELVAALRAPVPGDDMPLGHTLACGHAEVEPVYAMRKRAVGLLGNVSGEARPQPFVEDTAVPPERLADYIAEFRALLDGYGLAYGMFGHVDAGVLHVRPLLDMKDAAQAALVRPLSEAVAALTRRHGGLLWGEHGKGLRSEFAPERFGTLWPAVQAVKGAFDPHGQLNPGKIATPSKAPHAALRRVDEVPLRADGDRRIATQEWHAHGAAMHCNGNGACFNVDPDDPMCPSWKATRDRRHSPKGRASLMREWLRLQAEVGGAAVAGEDDFAHEVHDAMSGCLACKSCSGQCPVRVDVPELRAQFLARYHRRYRRPLKDWLVASLETALPLAARVPGLYGAVLRSPSLRGWLERHGGLVDLPSLSDVDLRVALAAPIATPRALAALSPERRARCVVLVPDAFTRWFDTPAFVALGRLVRALGHEPWIAPYRPNGKPLHVHGFLDAFARAARRQAAMLAALARTGVPLVGLDPAMTLTYRQEYRKSLGDDAAFDVALPQEWLDRVLPAAASEARVGARYSLLGHCTERTTAPAAAALWTGVFERAGLTLRPLAAGCCGMSGTYGHETRHRETSRVIFGQSWEPLLAGETGAEPLATGYSCRSQVQRFGHRRLRHPVEVLLSHLGAAALSPP